MAILIGDNAIVADRNPVGISAEVLKNPLGAIEGWLAIDHPFLIIEFIPEAGKGSRFLEMTYSAGECEFLFFEAVIEKVKELSSEQR